MLLGCSKDDSTLSKNPAEILVKNSPWVFERTKIERITSNFNNRTQDDLQRGFEDEWCWC